MSSKAKILIVEDEPAAAAFMTFLLTRAGYDVKTILNGRSGLEAAKLEKFDLILLETDLPDISGLKISAELKQRHIACRTPIVFLSSQSGDEYRKQALELGAVDYITKPLKASEFILRILSHVRQAEEVSC